MKKHQNLRSIDYYAYDSGIRDWNPFFKVCIFMLILIFCIVADNLYISVTVILEMLFITVILGRIKLHDYLVLLRIPLAFIILGSIAIIVQVGKGNSTEIIEQSGKLLVQSQSRGQMLESDIVLGKEIGIYYVYLTKDSICQGALLMLKAFGAISAMYALTLSTPTNEIISVLRKLHIPKMFLELMTLIYRYIFILMDTQCRIKYAAESRLGYVDFKTSCNTFGNSMGSLLVVSLKKSREYYNAMEARGYDGELLFLEEEKVIEGKQLLIMGVCIAILIILEIIFKII